MGGNPLDIGDGVLDIEKKEKEKKVKKSVNRYWLIVIGFLLSGGWLMAKAQEIPDWWITRGIVNTNATTNDYASVNIGQLKQVALQTWAEVTNELAQLDAGDITSGEISTNVLPSFLADGDDVIDADASVSNELNAALSFVSSNSVLQLTDAGGTLTADLSELVDVESDPTVLASVKDGVSWSELSNRPSGLDDGDDVIDADASVSNELNAALSFVSSNSVLQLTDAGGVLSVDLSDLVDMETDPVWTAASNTYSTTAEAGGLYVNVTGDTLSGTLDMQGNALTNGLFYGDGSGLTNLNVVTTETDPAWHSGTGAIYTAIALKQNASTAATDIELTTASNALQSAIGNLQSELSTNYSTTAEADALYVNLSGDTMTGDLTITSNLVVGTGTATGLYAVAEGYQTIASGEASHAAGKNAKAMNNNTYVWSDGQDISSTATRQYTVYAQNGIRLLGGPVSGDGSGLTNLNTAVITTAESDPQVGANTTNILSKWDGSALVSGSIYDNGNIGIGTTIPTEKLEVSGKIKSTLGGFEFPDGTTQTTAVEEIIILKKEVSFTIGSTRPAHNSYSETKTFLGVELRDTLTWGYRDYLSGEKSPNGMIFSIWVSGTDEITIRGCNVTDSPISVQNQLFTVKVIKW